MRLQILKEPKLQFGRGQHVCPRAGIQRLDVYDSVLTVHRDRLWIGAVGIGDDLESLETWVARCQRRIPAKLHAKQPTLFPAFCGFNEDVGFRATMSLESEITRTILKKDIREVVKIKDFNPRVNTAVTLFVPHVKFLCQNRTVDVVVCVIPDDLYDVVSKKSTTAAEDRIEDSESDDLVEVNFRRSLKAACLHLGVPLQLIPVLSPLSPTRLACKTTRPKLGTSVRRSTTRQIKRCRGDSPTIRMHQELATLE